MAVFVKVFEEIIQRGVLVVVGRRATDDLFVQNSKLLMRFCWIKCRD